MLTVYSTSLFAFGTRLASQQQRSTMDFFPQIGDIFLSERYSAYRNFATVVGALYLLKISVGLARTLGSGFCAYFLGPRLGVCGVDLKSFGSWAVVTGASEGIGRGYALELARRGLNVVLMSRSQEKLDKVAKEIQDTYHRKTLTIPVDFTEGEAIYPRLRNQLKGLEIGVLVNNVGLSHKFAQYFLEADEQRLRDIVELNCQAMVQMTHLLLPAMVTRGRGAIINISSGFAINPQPFVSVYSASKIFANYFSEALAREYQSKGILVQTAMPNFVSTAMTKIPRNLFVPSGTVYARSAVATIGVQSTTFGHLPHAFLGFLLNIVPNFIVRQILWMILLYARSRYLKIMAQRKAKN